MKRNYLVILERADDGSASAYVPDLPGCIAAADSVAEVERLIHEAIDFHIEGLRERGASVPPPVSESRSVQAG